MTDRLRYSSVACGFITLVLGIGWYWYESGPRSQNEKPHAEKAEARAEETSVFIGHQRCADCHADIHKSHIATPHSRTLTVTKGSSAATALCDQKHFGGEDFGTFAYICDKEGLAVSLPERFPDRLFPLDYAFGSGEHAVTFLTLLDDGGETVAVEHRMSWFRNGERVDITPGQAGESPNRDMDCFGKVFRGRDMHRCINCHVTTGKVVNARIEDLTAGIQCERCHGPGAAHVSAAEKGDLTEAMNSIQHGWTGSEEVAMCGECHRMPKEIAPKRLKEYPDSLVRFQPVGLLQSRCYLGSNGTMKCTSCHDAHDDVHSRTSEVQNESCKACHSTDSQTQCRAGEKLNCIECHMPAIELLPGISFHDHWIRVRSDKVIESKASDSTGHSEVK